MKGIPGLSAVSGFLARIRSLGRGLFRRADVEAEMNEEFRHHIELRTEDLVRRGLSPRNAARRARLEFGHIEAHKEAGRLSRGLMSFDQLRLSWLDVKLGWRVLWKHPFLSTVSVLTLAAGIPLGLAPGQFLDTLEAPLPVEEGERVVGLRYWSLDHSGPAPAPGTI